MDFFRDSRSHTSRNSIQVRILYSSKLAFESKDDVVYKNRTKDYFCKSPVTCCSCCYSQDDIQSVTYSAAQQNLQYRIEKVILHFHGGAFVCMESF